MVTSVNNSTGSIAQAAANASNSTGASKTTTTTTSPTEGAGASIISALGGSQIDIQALATKLVEAERAPQQSLIDTQKEALQNKITSIGRIYASAATMKDQLSVFGSDPRSTAYTAQSTDPSKATFTFKGQPSPFNLTLSVKQLATENKVTLNAFSGTWPTSGKLSITQGTRATSNADPLEFDYADYTSLEGLRDAINKAGPYKAEIMNTIVNGTKTQYLSLSRGTGTERNFFVSTTDDNGDPLSSGVYVTPPAAGKDPGQATGVDAIISSGGQDYTYFKNSFADLLPGATINIGATTAPGETITLSTAVDSSKYTAILRQMVASYNDLQATISSEIHFDSDTAKRGGLSSDPVARGFMYQMRRMTTDTITTYNGNKVSLSSLGVRTSGDGTLTIDETALAKAQLDPDLMEAVLASSGTGKTAVKGAYQKLTEFTNTIMGRDSALVKEFNQVNTTEMAAVLDKEEKLNQRMDALKQRYLKQFISMQDFLDSTQNAQKSLTQSMAAWTASMKN